MKVNLVVHNECTLATYIWNFYMCVSVPVCLISASILGRFQSLYVLHARSCLIYLPSIWFTRVTIHLTVTYQPQFLQENNSADRDTRKDVGKVKQRIKETAAIKDELAKVLS